MSDPIERQAAIDEVARWTGYLDEDMITRIQIGLKRLPPAQRKILKYTGESICLSCQTTNCDGCICEPMTDSADSGITV